MEKLLIAFEGLPGGGKTTLVERLATHFGGAYMEEVVEHTKFLPSQDAYYIESERLKLELFARSQSRLNFFDRSFYSMMAYHYGKKQVGRSHSMDTLETYLQTTRKPDVFVYLRIADVALCNQRKARGRDDADVWTREDALIHIRDFYDAFFSPEQNRIIIETDQRTLDEVFALLIQEMLRWLKRN
jgi:thymidylate kinase